MARLKAALARFGGWLSQSVSGLHNIRYMTGNPIGRWAIDKMIRSRSPAGGEPGLDFGSAAAITDLCAMLDTDRMTRSTRGIAGNSGAPQAGISLLRGAFSPDSRHRPSPSRPRSTKSSRRCGMHTTPVGRRRHPGDYCDGSAARQRDGGHRRHADLPGRRDGSPRTRTTHPGKRSLCCHSARWLTRHTTDLYAFTPPRTFVRTRRRAGVQGSGTISDTSCRRR